MKTKFVLWACALINVHFNIHSSDQSAKKNEGYSIVNSCKIVIAKILGNHQHINQGSLSENTAVNTDKTTWKATYWYDALGGCTRERE